MYQSHRCRHAVKVAVAIAILAAMMGADGGCEQRGSVKSDRPASDRQVDPKRQRTVIIRVTEATGPYDVWVRAAKDGQDRGDYTRDKRAGGEYRQTLDYPSGIHITVTITVTGRSDDIFRCEISDGEHLVRERRAGQVQCKLTTSR